ncbi:unnamed protein product [Mytilus coruscus]|uniref:KCTD1_15 n=1 Tax=Mytilus coruscus TaxID=42192 RepID=A0A6J8BWW1_MYTCO|nr:unnamed protein product [Mytilus coruscus]
MSANTTAGGREGERFGTAEDDDIDDKLNDVLARNTQKSTIFALKLVYDYCVSKGLDANIEDRNPASLNKLLKEFYVNIRQANGDFYSRSSFCVIRQSINRHLKQPPHNKPFDIISDTDLLRQTTSLKQCYRNEQSVQNYVRDTSAAQKRDMSASIPSYTAANSTAHLNQNNNNENMNNSIFDFNESDLTEAQYDTIFESIQQGEAELHPLSDITNRNPPAQNTGMNKHPIVFNNCNVTIHNIS